jgi:hypothetical protein
MELCQPASKAPDPEGLLELVRQVIALLEELEERHSIESAAGDADSDRVRRCTHKKGPAHLPPSQDGECRNRAKPALRIVLAPHRFKPICKPEILGPKGLLPARSCSAMLALGSALVLDVLDQVLCETRGPFFYLFIGPRLLCQNLSQSASGAPSAEGPATSKPAKPIGTGKLFTCGASWAKNLRSPAKSPAKRPGHRAEALFVS